MTAEPYTVEVLPSELESAREYARLSLPHTYRKLDQQRSRFASQRNHERILWFRVARSVVARVLRDRWFLQVRFIDNRPNYRRLLEEVRSFNTRPADFYVAARSRDGLQTLDILGYATRTELLRRRPWSFGQGVVNRYVPLAELHGFRELLNDLQGHRAVIEARSGAPGAHS